MPSQKEATISCEKNAIKDKIQMEIKQNTNGDYLLKDSEGKSHIVRKDLAQQWLDTFGLKSLSDDFVPNFTPQIKEILSQNGVDKIHLKIGSLLKMQARDRGDFVDFIKPTLQNPDFVLKDENGIIFVKDIGKEKVVFTSVVKDEKGEYIVRTNSLKRIKTLKNKLALDGEIIYQNKEASNILVEAFTS